jgi:hypothetical protein
MVEPALLSAKGWTRRLATRLASDVRILYGREGSISEVCLCGRWAYLRGVLPSSIVDLNGGGRAGRKHDAWRHLIDLDPDRDALGPGHVKAHLAAEPGICDRNNRSWRSRTAIRRAPCSRPRLDRASCQVRHQGAGWHPLQAYRAIAPIAAISLFLSYGRRAVHGRCVAIPPWPTTLAAGNWSMAARRLSPYRSRASPSWKLPAFTNFARPIAIAHTRQAERLYCTSAMNNPLKNHDPQCLCLTCRRFCESAMANKVTMDDRIMF